jgi:hypothetical protein
VKGIVREDLQNEVRNCRKALMPKPRKQTKGGSPTTIKVYFNIIISSGKFSEFFFLLILCINKLFKAINWLSTPRLK